MNEQFDKELFDIYVEDRYSNIRSTYVPGYQNVPYFKQMGETPTELFQRQQAELEAKNRAKKDEFLSKFKKTSTIGKLSMAVSSAGLGLIVWRWVLNLDPKWKPIGLAMLLGGGIVASISE